MRAKIVAGNWKMNKDKEAALSLISEVTHIAKDELIDDVKVIIIPPFVHLSSAVALTKESSKVSVGAQNCSEHTSGAYTGEIAADMLASYDVSYVVLGHSERRQYFNETHAQLAQKTDQVLANNLTPIFCCGEPLEIRESNTQKDFVCNQLKESLFHLSAEAFSKIVIAYEPIWAIGTGKTASAAQAQEMHKDIRDFIATKYGQEIADNCSILYGGSCKPANAKELFACEDVDGGLIGGASLKSRDFVDIALSF